MNYCKQFIPLIGSLILCCHSEFFLAIILLWIFGMFANCELDREVLDVTWYIVCISASLVYLYSKEIPVAIHWLIFLYWSAQ